MIRDAALGRVPARDAVAAFADAGFEEAKHPREHGKFASAAKGAKSSRLRAANHTSAVHPHYTPPEIAVHHKKAAEAYSKAAKHYENGNIAEGDKHHDEGEKHGKNAKKAVQAEIRAANKMIYGRTSGPDPWSQRD